jgi:predicted RecA/RadA family phage recombinase
MQNKVSDGRTAVITAPAAVKAGNIVIVGGRLGVAINDIANGAKGLLDMTGGVYILTGTAALSASTVGATVYTASTNTVIDGNAVSLEGGTGTRAIGQLERPTDGTATSIYIRVKSEL